MTIHELNEVLDYFTETLSKITRWLSWGGLIAAGVLVLSNYDESCLCKLAVVGFFGSILFDILFLHYSANAISKTIDEKEEELGKEDYNIEHIMFGWSKSYVVYKFRLRRNRTICLMIGIIAIVVRLMLW